MGLLDQLASQALGAGNSGSGNSPLLQIAGTLLQGQGGLRGLLEKFNAAGLGQQAASWVGTGANLPVDASQITAALGHGELANLAAKLGLDSNQVSSGLAQLLPGVIDKLTPNGTTEGADSLASQGLSSVLGKLF